MTLAKCALAVVLGTAFAAGPAFADQAEDLKKALEKLDKLSKEVLDLKDSMKIEELRGKAITIDTKLDMLDKDILEIKKDIKDIKRKVGDNSSTSLRPDLDSAIARGLGRVRFINEISEEMSVVVNGKSFRLLPGQERLISVPAGNFTSGIAASTRRAGAPHRGR